MCFHPLLRRQCCLLHLLDRPPFHFYFIYALALLIPSLAIAVRRLHDTGKSGWMILLGLIPFIGFIILIVFYVQPSDGPNEYGAGPED